MTTTTATVISATVTQSAQGKSRAGETGGFSDILSSKDNFLQLTSDLLDNIIRSVRGSQSGSNSGISAPAFPFSSAFESTFGLSGPLPEFITRVTASLGLSKEKNLALQNIAINNKDITKTQENVQKIAAELKAAGIGY